MSLTISGNWFKDGNHYTNTKFNFSIVLATRKHPTENKPNRYALIKHPEGKPEYLSGLYPTQTEGVFKIDYQGKKYTIEQISTTQLFIKPRKP
jgi:hypothetical protein